MLSADVPDVSTRNEVPAAAEATTRHVEGRVQVLGLPHCAQLGGDGHGAVDIGDRDVVHNRCVCVLPFGLHIGQSAKVGWDVFQQHEHGR